MITKIVSWKTSDGTIFETEIEAVRHDEYNRGKVDGLMIAINRLEDLAKMGAGGNLTKEEVENSDLWKNAQMLRGSLLNSYDVIRFK